MLTSMFYYHHYKPYMIKPASSESRSSSNPDKTNKPTPSERTVAPDVSRNKSLNKEVVEYAQGIYKNTTDLKYTSKKLQSDLRSFDKYRDFEEFDSEAFEENFADDLEDFASSFNKSKRFLNTQEHSPYLKDVSQKLDKHVENALTVLNRMGIKKNENGELEVDRKENTFWKSEDSETRLEDAADLFGNLYKDTADVLNNPMSKHMNFKNLSYYYNYQVDRVQVDSFQIIKTGLLVNIAL